MRHHHVAALLVAACNALACSSNAPEDAPAPCERDDECDTRRGEICDDELGECVRPCYLHDMCDWRGGEVCCTSLGSHAACRPGPECPGWVDPYEDPPPDDYCGANSCGDASCIGNADCYEEEAYCATDWQCYGVRCGDPSNDCESCALAPPKDPDGPLLYDPAQIPIGTDTSCVKDPVVCPEGGNLCEFEILVFDPQDDLARTPSAFYRRFRLVGPDGELRLLPDVPILVGDTIRFRACFAQNLTSLGGAVQLADEAGNSSNAHCFSGRTP